MMLPSEKHIKWIIIATAAVCAAAAVAVLRPVRLFGPEAPLVRISSGTFSSSLDALLKNEGLNDAERYKASRELGRKLNLRRLRPEDAYSMTFSTWGPMRQLVITKDLQEYSLSVSSGEYSLSVRPVELTEGSSTVYGNIKSSLWESMISSGVPAAVILDYADIFSWSVDFLTEVRDGDKWALSWDYKTDPSGRMVSQKVKSAYYDGEESGRKSAAAWGDGYYDEKGDSLRSMFLRAPLHYRRISSYFTGRRFHPVLKIFRAHYGIDYAAPTGTPVSAVADGRVVYAAWKGQNGRLVILKHAAGYETFYGHLSRFARGIRSGRRVSQGDVIAYVGTSGLSSGPHLDFRVKLNGKPLNFLKIKYRSSASVSGKARKAVAEAIAALELR
jgi:hypothetical protein